MDMDYQQQQDQYYDMPPPPMTGGMGMPYYSQGVSDTLIEKQQDLTQLYDAFCSLLSGLEKREDENGDLRWFEVVGAKPILNTEGIRTCMAIFKSLVNANNLNSSYNDKQIRHILGQTSRELVLILYMNYPKWTPNISDDNALSFDSAVSIVNLFILNTAYQTLLRALDGKERETSRQKYSISDVRSGQPRRGLFQNIGGLFKF